MPILYFNSPIENIPEMTEAKASLLQKSLRIFTIYDLLTHFPYKYIDRSRVYSSSELNEKLQYIQLYGQLNKFNIIGEGKKQRLVAIFSDKSGHVELVWFKGIKWFVRSLKLNQNYLLFGKPQKFGNKYNIVHPEMRLAKPSDVEKMKGYRSIYSSTETMKKRGLDSNGIAKLINITLKNIDKNELNEFLPSDIIKETELMTFKESLKNIHFPSDNNSIELSKKRMKFNEFFNIQIQLKKSQHLRFTVQKGFLFETLGDHFHTFYKKHLPFKLTSAQQRVLKDIRKDTLSNRQMNRLLQGDVGSGKTVVAIISMLIALDNNFQACIMAPTEILAMQHFQGIQSMLKGMNIHVEILTGSTKKKERIELLDNLLHGKIDILIGTHALIEPKVVFKNLGLVVIDEQHRFGVAQRSKLWAKNTLAPHVLVMTATPIPRTLAMTIYGDLDISVIDELPPGRKPVKTMHSFFNKKIECYQFLKREIEKGRQIYIVYPLIEESKKLDLQNLIDGFESLKEIFPSPKYSLAMVHGKMKNEEKSQQMDSFVSGQTNILVSTTVIEVGVNVPNASIMLINNAERFGLSQLHQLRGRVGRGSDQSYCILMTDYKLTHIAKKRMQIMVESNDGFYIAEEDLKLRGPGDISGTRQSGDVVLKLASISQDSDILKLSQDVALKIINKDPLLESEELYSLKNYLKKVIGNLDLWSKIS